MIHSTISWLISTSNKFICYKLNSNNPTESSHDRRLTTFNSAWVLICKVGIFFFLPQAKVASWREGNLRPCHVAKITSFVLSWCHVIASDFNLTLLGVSAKCLSCQNGGWSGLLGRRKSNWSSWPAIPVAVEVGLMLGVYDWLCGALCVWSWVDIGRYILYYMAVWVC